MTTTLTQEQGAGLMAFALLAAADIAEPHQAWKFALSLIKLRDMSVGYRRKAALYEREPRENLRRKLVTMRNQIENLAGTMQVEFLEGGLIALSSGRHRVVFS